jgi:hypothetical protein
MAIGTPIHEALAFAGSATPLLYALSFILLSFLAGMASYHLLEKHFLALKRLVPLMESAACSIAGLDCLRVGTPRRRACKWYCCMDTTCGRRSRTVLPFAECPALFHFPAGPLQSPSGNRCWWPIDQERRTKQLESGPRDLCEESPPGPAGAREAAVRFLDELRARRPNYRCCRRLLAGRHAGLRHGAVRAPASIRPRHALVVAHCIRDWQANRDVLAGLPVLVSHGSHDADLAFSDFADAELAQVIETIARATNRNFIYDDRVRGRVTIVSPEPIPVEQAYAVFESVLQVKGFTTVTTPGGAIKVIPVREAKESSIETVQSGRRPPNRDYYVTRLIPLRYIDADSIVNTLKPLVSKDAAMAAYPPTNTVILTESASNIRRLIQILESIDVETYKEDLAVINVEYADAATLADQVSEIYGAEVAEGGAFDSRARRGAAPPVPAPTPTRRARTSRRADPHRRAHQLAARARGAAAARGGAPAGREARHPRQGGGRIHVYYLNNANAEELAETLAGLVGGRGRCGSSSSSSRSSTTGGGRRGAARRGWHRWEPGGARDPHHGRRASRAGSA